MRDVGDTWTAKPAPLLSHACLVHVPAPSCRAHVTGPLYLSSLALPSAAPTHTELLPLRPLPKSAVGNPGWEGIWKFSHFNAVQVVR